MRMHATWDELNDNWVAETGRGNEVTAATELECEEAAELQERWEAVAATPDDN